MRAMSQKERNFAQAVADGLSLSGAYRKAFDASGSSINTIKCEAHRVVNRPRVAEYLAQLRAQQDKQRFLTRERKRERLWQIVESDETKPGECIKAIEVDNVMTGDNAPQRVEVFGLSELLEQVRKQSR